MTRIVLWLLLAFVAILLMVEVLHARPGMPQYYAVPHEERPDPQMPRPLRPAVPDTRETNQETVP